MHWSPTVLYWILGFIVLISPISWIAEDRKRAAKKAAEGQPASGSGATA